jgi:hypothetical protein
VKDSVLIVWLLVSALGDVLVFGTATYLIFWRDRSGWWFLLAVALTYQPTLCKALGKRYGVEDES